MEAEHERGVPETHVLAIASHVTSGYVGNTMATFCMQTLGCEVSAINTVNYSNHVGYGRFTGRKSSPEEVDQLFQGLKDAGLDEFDVLLSGYCPSAALVEQVGKIGRDLKLRHAARPGAFFWVLDPVMGDDGRMYVAEETIPVYKSLLNHADLILPNQFEAELLSGVKIHDVPSMVQAVSQLHCQYRLPHIIITSARLQDAVEHSADLSIIGSTADSELKPRLFRITVPVLPVFFSGTGDMFASLLIARLRQAANEDNLLTTPSWRSSDDVTGPNLPLARAAEKVLASMHHVLEDTARAYEVASSQLKEDQEDAAVPSTSQEDAESRAVRHRLRMTRAAEVRVVRNSQALRAPDNIANFRAQKIDATT